MTLRGLLGLVAVLAACGTTEPVDPSALEASLERRAVTVVRGERFTLTSPYDAAGTEEYARVVGEELDRVEAVLGALTGPPVRVHLVPADEGASDLFPSRHGISGGSFDTGFVCVYVAAPGTGRAAVPLAELRRGTIRHELVHNVSARTGLSGQPWFDEGVAREFQSMREDGHALREHPLPAALLEARATARAGSVAELLAWGRAEPLSPEERERRYGLAQSLVRYLAARAPGTDLGQRLRAVRALSDDELLASERAWLDWLGTLDALTTVRAGLESRDPRARRQAASLLPVLAGTGAAELSSRTADEFALALLGDPDALDPAATFLLFFRAVHLLPADLAALRASSEPASVLVGEALRARRHEPFEAGRARKLWVGLPDAERANLLVVASLLHLDSRR